MAVKSWLAAAILASVLGSPAFASSRSQRERGAVVFATSGCQHCHSIHNVGGHRGPDLSNVGRTKSKAAMRKQILYGDQVMPPFQDVLQQRQLDDLIAYLRSCKETPGPP
jgi:mono/diheme cytochrome c family protein